MDYNGDGELTIEDFELADQLNAEVEAKEKPVRPKILSNAVPRYRRGHHSSATHK